jgi:hypothetical protein
MTSPIHDPLEGIDLGALLEHGQEADAPDPADPQPMVKSSIKLPVELYDWLRSEAQRTGVGVSTLLRQFAEEKRAKASGGQVLVSLDDVERVISDLIRRSHPAA